MSIIIGIDHGYYAIKTAHCSFPAGLTSYGEHEPYTRQGLLEFGGCFFVCGSGRQPIQRDKTANDNYYLLTLAAIAKEIRQRGLPPECSVRIAAGLPLTSFGRDKPKFKDYLLRSKQPVNFRFEGVEYSITIEEVAIFPQGYAALMTETGLLQDEPSMLLMDLGGWTVDLMRIDNAIPVADTAHSLELGMIRCVDDIREQVRRETGLSLTNAQIENMLAGQPCTVSDTVRDIVNKQGRKYTEHLLSATMEAGFDLHAIPAVLLGGASVMSKLRHNLCQWLYKTLIKHTHQLHICSCRVAQRSEDIEYGTDSKFLTDRCYVLHCDMIILCKQETDVDLFEKFCTFFRGDRDVYSKCFKNICCTTLGGCCTVSVFCNRHAACCDHQ